jgi:hypothetical protein
MRGNSRQVGTYWINLNALAHDQQYQPQLTFLPGRAINDISGRECFPQPDVKRPPCGGVAERFIAPDC